MRTKRPFMVVICITVLALFTTSCGPVTAPTVNSQVTPQKVQTPVANPSVAPRATSAGTRPSAEQPRYGGALRIVAEQEPPTYDIHQIARSDSYPVMPAYSGVLGADETRNDTLIPDLAERWETAKDGLSYSFWFRNGITWHDGKPFSSLDAKASLERIIRPPKGVAIPYSNWLGSVDRIEVPDDSRMTIIMKKRDPSVPYVIADGRFKVMPRHVFEAKGNMNRDVVGTGAFKLKEHRQGASLELEKSANYFIKGRPYLDRLVFYFIKDRATRFAAFRTGRVDMTIPATAGLTAEQANTLKREFGEKAPMRVSSLINVNVIRLNTGKAPFNDVRIRKAMHLAIDRQSAIKVVNQEYGKICTFLPAPGNWSRAENELAVLPGYRQPKDDDRAEARRLLAEAGYPSGIEIPFMVRNISSLMKDAEFLSGDLRKVGITLKLQITETTEWTSRMQKEDYIATNEGVAYAVDLPEQFWAKGLMYGETSFRDDDLEKIMNSIYSAIDDRERHNLWRQIEDRLFQLVPIIPTRSSLQMQGVSNRVRGYGEPVGNYNWLTFRDVWMGE